MIPTGIITVGTFPSGEAFQTSGGPSVRAAVAVLGWRTIAEAIVPDELEQIARTVLDFSRMGCQLILTIGGTGISGRDVTPEAVRSIARFEIPGFGESMRTQSKNCSSNAILSRSVGAVVKNSLVITLPGAPAGATEWLGFVAPVIPRTVELLICGSIGIDTLKQLHA